MRACGSVKQFPLRFVGDLTEASSDSEQTWRRREGGGGEETTGEERGGGGAEVVQAVACDGVYGSRLEFGVLGGFIAGCLEEARWGW
jgi:hypothetical protein